MLTDLIFSCIHLLRRIFGGTSNFSSVLAHWFRKFIVIIVFVVFQFISNQEWSLFWGKIMGTKPSLITLNADWSLKQGSWIHEFQYCFSLSNCRNEQVASSSVVHHETFSDCKLVWNFMKTEQQIKRFKKRIKHIYFEQNKTE